jgi:hypothetical protein
LLPADSVPHKYYLSPKACAGVLKRVRLANRKMPELLEKAMESVVANGQA